MCGDSPKYALRKALVVTRTSTILDSVVEVNIGRLISTYKDLRSSFKVPYLLTPTLFKLVNAIPAMRQLHTIHVNNIILSRIYLHTILSSPHLIHLILEAVQMPRISTLPPAKIRKLTLKAMSSWETVQPLISQLATSLEYLSLQGCEFRTLSQDLQLPSLPCLQELHHHQVYSRRTFSDNGQLNELLRLGSQLTHLLVTGQTYYDPVTACRNSLQHLSINDRMLTEEIFGIVPFPRLMHLSLRQLQFSDAVKNPLKRSLFIRDHFPRITSLHFHIPWFFRNYAMAIARSQHNVQTLTLAINTEGGIEYEENVMICSLYQVEIPNELHQAMSPTTLHTFKLEVTQDNFELERSAARCTQWVHDDIIPPVMGLGGPGLTSIDISVSKPKIGSIVRERVLLRRWVKVAHDGWQKVE